MVLSLLVSLRFQVLFHSPPGVLFTFPSRYYSLSVTWSYLAFGDGPPFFRQDFSCPDVLRIPLSLASVSSTGVSPSSLGFPKTIHLSYTRLMCIRFLQFRSSLLSESLLLSFPLATKIFQFARSRLHCWIHTLLVCGFAHSDSCGYVYLQLPAAFRRSSRPSSPSSA